MEIEKISLIAFILYYPFYLLIIIECLNTCLMSFLLYILSILTEYLVNSHCLHNIFLLTTHQDLKNKNCNCDLITSQSLLPLMQNTLLIATCVYMCCGEHFTHVDTCGGLRFLHHVPPHFLRQGFSLNLELAD